MLYRTEVESYGQGAALVGREEVPVKEVEILEPELVAKLVQIRRAIESEQDCGDQVGRRME
jgi:hypothetical protein